MTRRQLFAFIPALMDESPKNQLAASANAFNAQFTKWATAFNRVKPGTLDAGENEAFQPLAQMWRKVEHLRTIWIRGI
jgi:hypothetical protein